MYRLATRCGREIAVTGDHNFWVLRDGFSTLIRSEEARDSDFLPVPDIVTDFREDLRSIDILPYLAGTRLSVFAEAPILDFVEATGTDGFVAAMNESGISPVQKLSAIRRGVRGRGLKVRHFLNLLAKTGGLAGHYYGTQSSVGGKKHRCRLPVTFPLSDSNLSLFGYYVAEGNAQRGYIILSNYHPVVRAKIESGLRELGIPFFVRANSDYQVSSTALASLLSALCGQRAQSKRLPEFWPRLSSRSLGILLKAYFDGDGTVGTAGEVSATTASDELASDLAYALKRFGIHARLRRVRKRATNSNHAGAIYSCVVISGQLDLRRVANPTDPRSQRRSKSLPHDWSSLLFF